MDIWGVSVFIDGENGAIPYIHPIKYSDMWILVLLGFFFIFRTMPKIHITGRSSNSSLELGELGTSYVTGSSLLVPAESYNLSIAISTTTNTMDTGNSFCGIVFLIICFCFALVIMIAIGIWLVRKRKIMKTQENDESNVSLHLLPIP